ncbi:restriction endonuclease subunit S [Steroidobacter cummioxidans]|uniref:restriction endonuclease subunit S n=1 Tax=Steroidobacter cummioxidans TaxID=1803913 RepID=UPI000E31D02F|nr:restriction endonuclease subunit S [Steroidobacter cummioxidans]
MSGWPSVRLGDVFDISRGGSPRPIDSFITDQSDGINWIMIGDASEGSKYICATKKRIRAEGAKKSRAVKPGDFLLTNSMSFGRPYIMKTSGCIHDGWLVLSPRQEISQDFFYHLLGSKAVYAEFERLAAGATVKNLNSELVRGVKVRLPPLPEQRRIAEILDKADALRAKRRAVIAQLDTLAQAIFLDMFGDPTTNPKGFAKQPLESLICADDTINYGVVQPGNDERNGVPLIRVSDLVDGRVEQANLKRIAPSIEAAYKRSRLRGNELLVSCVGTIGLVATTDESVRGFNIARAVARVPIADDDLRAFLYAYLQTSHVQRYFTSELRTVSQPTLNIKQLSETEVLLTPRQLQSEFRERLRELERQRRMQLAAEAQGHGLFQSIQEHAFRGEL